MDIFQNIFSFNLYNTLAFNMYFGLLGIKIIGLTTKNFIKGGNIR